MKIERIREKLGKLVEQRGISMRALSLRAGLIHNAVSNILKHNQERVDYSHLERILRILGISFAEFWEPDDGPVAPPGITAPPGMRLASVPPTTVMVPDCGTVSAGPFRLPDPDRAQRFYAGTREDEGSFALSVAGDSMCPEYREGEVLFLHRLNVRLVPLPRGVQVGVPFEQVKSLNGKDCVVLMADTGCTFKRLRIEKGAGETYTVTLLPVNAAHDRTVIRPDDDMWIQGVCYKSIRNR